MKEQLRELLHSGGGDVNILREYLQVRILESLQRAGAMVPLAFHGGTALRLLHRIHRFSEDLDFALVRSDAGWDMDACLQAIRSSLEPERYEVQFKVKKDAVVKSAFVRFPGLLHEMDLSAHPAQVFSIKIEVDTRPPEGAGLGTSIVRRHRTLHLQHHDRPTMLAGKLHAIIQRTYTKGRDVFDLFWYLGQLDWPVPNLIFLNNALRQTGWKQGPLDESSWIEAARRRVEEIDWKPVVDELRAFVESEYELDMLTRENVLKVIGQRASRAK